jgi:hypothetical protein
MDNLIETQQHMTSSPGTLYVGMIKLEPSLTSTLIRSEPDANQSLYIHSLRLILY